MRKKICLAVLLAIDALVFIVNPKNPVKNLTADQVRMESIHSSVRLSGLIMVW